MDKAEQQRRLAILRAELERCNLTAFLVPRADEHQGEYVPPSAERLAWISGFSGSAGLAVVSRTSAALFVDGRYTQQALLQAEGAFWNHHRLAENVLEEWLEKTFSEGDRIGFDPWLHTSAGMDRLRRTLERFGAMLVATEKNLIDVVWDDRPALPKTAIELYPEALAGESAASKRVCLAAELRAKHLEALIISASDSLAWLFNIRGEDVAHTPVVLGFAVLHDDATVQLFLDPGKIPSQVREVLTSDHAITLCKPGAFGHALDALTGKRVRIDHATGAVWIVERLRRAGAKPDLAEDLCAVPKACKTDAELAGMRAAHVRDGIAMVRFFAWLAEVVPGRETEWTVAEKLDALRAEGKLYRDLSFETISGVGPNAAIPHYRVHKETALLLGEGEIYLVDSGGQYLDGTTDITRTTIIGNPSAEMCRRYTQVLKGHIALSGACFPEGTTGSQLDILARQFLWRDGVDFDHGTGHGVGCYLSVHEGPQRISKVPNTVALRSGMVLSNEPGYYKAGAFGIRIENLIAVVSSDPQPCGAEQRMLGFETLTLCPYERRLIDVSLLTDEEKAWIDRYHKCVRERLLSEVDPMTGTYLVKATEPLNVGGEKLR